ncbi:hypothetical protein D3C73_882080 [compost metagenome]
MINSNMLELCSSLFCEISLICSVEPLEKAWYSRAVIVKERATSSTTKEKKNLTNNDFKWIFSLI